MKLMKCLIILLCIQFSRQAFAAATAELEKHITPLPGGHGVVMFKAERLGPRSTGGAVPRNWDVFIARQDDGRGPQRLTNMQFYDGGGLDVSPDGSNIIFSAMVNRFPKDSFFALRLLPLRAVNPDEKRYVGGAVILDNGKHNVAPRCSPDGRHVLFLSKSPRRRTLGEALVPFRGTVHSLWEVCVIDLQTRAVTVVDKSNEAITQNNYSGDGAIIRYVKEGQERQVAVADIKADGNDDRAGK